MLREQVVYAGELKALRTIEGEMRRFLEQFRQEPLWTWPPQVVCMAQAVRFDLQLVEVARTRQGVASAAPLEEVSAEVGVYLEMPGEEAYELTTEHTRLLTCFSKMSAERRSVMLAFIEQEGIEL